MKGISAKNHYNIQVNHHSFTNSAIDTREFYLKNNLFLHTARLDKAPLTLQEATMCGLPCMTFDVGGCSEIIKDNYNGFVIPPFDINLYVDKLFLLITSQKKQALFHKNAITKPTTV